MPGFELVGLEELKEIQKLFEQGKGNLYRYGPNNYTVAEFEKRFAQIFGVKYAYAVSSGTAAIHCALAAVGVKPGDEVITTSYTFVAPIEAITALGAVPVCVEIDETYHLDPKAVEAAITEKTKAIVSIPMWAPPQMKEIVEICTRRGIALVEDSAQCLGGTYKSQKLGTFGKIASFSFDMGKTMTVGEGGMIITNDEELYKKASEFADHGHMHVVNLPRGKDPRRSAGLNYRMSELSGAIGLAQLDKLGEILQRQKDNKNYIKNGLKNIEGITFRAFSDEEGSLGDTLIFSFDDEQKAARVAQLLLEKGCPSKILPEAFDWHFAGSWTHIFEQFDRYDCADLPSYWPKTYSLLKRSVALPVFVKMSKERMDEVIKAVQDSVKSIMANC